MSSKETKQPNAHSIIPLWSAGSAELIERLNHAGLNSEESLFQ